jgi:imidazole glycerol-phosphate synthase subunit HisH
LISIIDYGVGNLRSVQKAFEAMGINAVITEDKKEISNSKALVLPGVGAFPDAMKELESKGITEEVLKAAKDGKPILGICLGMQLLFEVGYEIETCKGLGLIEGSIHRIEGDVKIPHMGWNSLEVISDSGIIKNVTRDSYVYFVHSFYAKVRDRSDLNAVTFYGSEIPAIVSRGNIFGIQFHPEKSGKIGMQILKNFGELVV